MTRLRRALASSTVAWLLLQVGAMATAPLALFVGSAEELRECTCAHGDHDICPMHHAEKKGAKVCVIRSAHDSSADMLSSLFVAVGLPAVTAHVSVLAPPQEITPASITTGSLRPAPPDPPPPRI